MRGVARLVVLAILLALILPARSVLSGALPSAHAAHPTSLHLQASLTVPSVMAGARAGLFVHTGAHATLTLTIHYAGGMQHTLTGAGDGLGRYVFSWIVPIDPRVAGEATLVLRAQRGALAGDWSSTLLVQALPLPPLFVQPLAPSFMAGTTIGLFVHTAPGAAVSYRLTADGGLVLGRGGAVADSQGRLVISTVETTILPRHALGVTAGVSVTTLAGTRTRTARFLLLPRPPLPLFAAPTLKAVRAGDPLTIFVSSAPGAQITVTVVLTSTVLARGTGLADSAGRWVFSTQVWVALKHPMLAHVRVRATRGIDNAADLLTFLMRPGPNVLGVPDHLAGPTNPAPNLHHYLAIIPDKVVLVSTESQTLRAYEHGILVHENYVTTGRPELPTVHGTFHVYYKQTPFEFISPWPPGSPWYYPPSWVRYWMPFFEGYGLHDAPWRRVYGPGTNLPHYSTDPGEPVGSHGCVNIPLSDMVWLWNWTPVGTTVVVY